MTPRRNRRGPDPRLMAPLAFAGFVLAGCGYVLLAKLSGAGAGYAAFVPVGIMAAYAATVTLARGLSLRDDQTGDNLYYMGFLFTLTSLGAALFRFSSSTTAGASDDIVRNFGIAVATTIAGVAGRVMFNQMRQDPLEVERTARLELADSARRVRRELDACAVEFSHFRRGLQQAMRESVEDTSNLVDEAGRRIVESMERTLAAAGHGPGAGGSDDAKPDRAVPTAGKDADGDGQPAAQPNGAAGPAWEGRTHVRPEAPGP